MASPWIAAIPTRSPVKDPGPAATANRSISASGTPTSGADALEVGRQPLAVRQRRVTGRLDEDRAVRTIARLPARVVVSSARISTATPIRSMLYFAPPTRSHPMVS